MRARATDGRHSRRARPRPEEDEAMRIGLDQMRRAPREQGGQVVILFALAAVVILGVVALAVDVGMAYHQRQQYQNLASNAAVAGSYEVYGFNHNSEVPA